MDKKLEMLIAVGVVVIILIPSIFILNDFLSSGEYHYHYEYDVKIDVSENNEAWYVNITDIEGEKITDGFFWDKHEKIDDPTLNSAVVEITIDKLNRNTTYLIPYFDFRNNMDNRSINKYGIKWIDRANDSQFGIDDTLVFLKEGGTEFVAESGDEIYLDDSDIQEGRYIKSNTIILS